jgi:hypothetical protein
MLPGNTKYSVNNTFIPDPTPFPDTPTDTQKPSASACLATGRKAENFTQNLEKDRPENSPATPSTGAHDP